MPITIGSCGLIVALPRHISVGAVDFESGADLCWRGAANTFAPLKALYTNKTTVLQIAAEFEREVITAPVHWYAPVVREEFNAPNMRRKL
jgi:hypothetical protein